MNDDIEFKTGALPDDVSEEDKLKRYNQGEVVVSIAPVTWSKKESYRKFPTRKQNGSGSCVMQSLEKERGILSQQKYGDFIIFSANPSYQLRSNPAISGSTYEDLIKATNYGGILESISPSQSLTDSQMMSAKKESYFNDMAKIFGAKRITMDLDIDTIASTIFNTGKAVGLTFRFGQGEWFGNYKVKELLPPSQWIYGHRVCAIDYTLDENGVKCLVIDDSACEDGYPERIIPESFLISRSFWKPNYIMNFKSYTEIGILPDKPHFVDSIVSAQKCFKYEGLFPVNVPEIENWGPITKKACIEFQKRYGIEPSLGNFGPITKNKLSELYP